jgi:hypothetical protein
MCSVQVVSPQPCLLWLYFEFSVQRQESLELARWNYPFPLMPMTLLPKCGGFSLAPI